MKEAAIPIFKSPKVQILDTTYLKKKKERKTAKDQIKCTMKNYMNF